MTMPSSRGVGPSGSLLSQEVSRSPVRVAAIRRAARRTRPIIRAAGKIVIAVQLCNLHPRASEKFWHAVDKFLKLLGFSAEREWERFVNCARTHSLSANEVALP